MLQQGEMARNETMKYFLKFSKKYLTRNNYSITINIWENKRKGEEVDHLKRQKTDGVKL
jgi:hypothetical protein